MEEKATIGIETLQSETEQFLAWVERHKTGFQQTENSNFIHILDECREKPTITEKVELIKAEIRKWIEGWWHPDIVGKLLERDNKKIRNHLRKEVIKEFPHQLTHYQDILNRFADDSFAVEEKKFRRISSEIIERIEKCLERMQETSEEARERKAQEGKDAIRDHQARRRRKH